MKLHPLLRSALFGFALAIAVSLHAASVIKLEFTQYEVRENEATVVIGVLRGGEVGQAGTWLSPLRDHPGLSPPTISRT